MAAGLYRMIGSVLLLCGSWLKAEARQEESMPPLMENALENETAGNDALPEDDANWQRLEAYARHKIQLNTADEATLQSLGMLTALQIGNFIAYRRLLGNLVSIYELQAVPGFEPDLIRQLLPYIRVGDDLAPHYTWHDYLHKGDHVWLLRYSRQLEKARGYEYTGSTPAMYRGSPDKVLLRYRYSFPRYISWGITMEKDAGEPWGGYRRQYGFDFYSAHLFLRNIGRLKAVAIGDFTANLGQGLLNWQSQAYGKGAAVMQIKREGEILRPYTSAGEYYFFRGAAATWQQKTWQITILASWRQLDGSLNAADTLQDISATSLVSSGYHRTLTEISKKGSIQQLSSGGNIRYQTRRWQVGVNVISHRLTPALQKEQHPYNQFEFNGAELTGASVDYAAYWKNVHLFGEAAVSDNRKPALVQGILTSLSPAVDMSVVYRYYDKAYQSFYAKGFGDNYRTVNEKGLYTGLTVQVTPRCKLDAYADIFHFPWLKYRADAPSDGSEFLLQLTYAPDKKKRFLLRLNSRKYEENLLVSGNALKILSDITTTHIRFQGDCQYRQYWSFKVRAEYSRYMAATGSQTGWMFYGDIACRLPRWPITMNARLARFQTDNYDTRMYAYERSVLYDNAVSQVYGRGWQYYLNVKYKVNKQLSCWMRVHQTIYPGKQVIGTGWDAIAGSKKTFFQLQLMQTL
ncbi:helix-hairpin-helix domain-containing protein [Chitinophaga sp. HK235]|uniref:ComEA family DNA-binding protein n=1 Tax=Chitinophaga sp. HK235 TaxID=2952571 RepID=UPI001BAD05DD|nr:helix-hairpin-helix domain-containing protein [Chitinophaga sp. HK235]